jgi:DNA (cytosine-5)-methyltransferase 1
MKLLNLYAGLGGNRKLWSGVKVTAVELNLEVAEIYKEYFPEDEVIVGDAHRYLIDHYNEFDFIWSSPPCPTHARPRMWASKGGRYPVKYPDMALYQEIIFLKHFFKGKYTVENVIPYYEPLIKPDVIIDRHCLWTNFPVGQIDLINGTQTWSVTSSTENYGFSVKDRKIKHRKDQLIRNLVNPELGLHVLEQARA